MAGNFLNVTFSVSGIKENKMPIRKFTPGQTISMTCPTCDGSGNILNRPLNAEAMEDEEKVKEHSEKCVDCNGTGKITGVVR